MSGAIGIIAFIATLLIMVMLHEFGHFITARKFGIKVEEFFIGFGPRLFSRWRGETEFGIKAILLGGYVRIAGMNPFQKIPEEELPRTFGAKPAWQRAIVLVAGSFTHFVLALVVFTFLYSTVGLHDFSEPLPTIDSVDIEVNEATGPAKAAGLRAGDKIVAISGKKIDEWSDVRTQIRRNPGKELVFEVERNGRRLDVPLTPVEAEVPVSPRSPEKTERVGQIGVTPQFKLVREPIHVAVWHGTKTTGEVIVASVKGIGQLFSPNGISGVFEALSETGDRQIDDSQPIGLVGAGRLAGQAGSAGAVETLVQFLAVFIVFVGVINLAPLPPLDGGHLAVLAIEKVFRRDVDMRKVIPVAAVVLAFFVTLTVALLYLDIFRPITDPFQ